MSAQPGTTTVTDTARQADRIAIVLASHGKAARSHVRQILENEHDMSVIAEASHLDSVRQRVREHHPDVVVLGLDTHRLPTLVALDALFSESQDTRYVVMNVEQDADQDALPDAIRLATSLRAR
jgi:DNA-binding NarL/FixJ family response regulator